MSKKVVITGGAGLVGSECCRLYASKGWKVIAIDNNMRRKILGVEADVYGNRKELEKEFNNVEFLSLDIRSENSVALKRAVKGADVIIHTASQPSHPRSIEIPVLDFQINAWGTLNLLELTRGYAKDAVFIFCSTDKVYGENSNLVPTKELKMRYDYTDRDGIDESMSVDQTMHTPFGVSKVVADLYVQEYARLYGLKTGIFRMCCITGSSAKAVEKHNWIPHFFKKNLRGENLNIFGFKGKQVRGIIHAKDLARLFWEFAKKPRSGEVYNVGGGRQNSISLLEAIEKIESITGQKFKKIQFCPAREGDHNVYISDISKVKKHYDWDIKIGLDEIFQDIYRSLLW